MPSDNKPDWRLQGQEKYLLGVTLIHCRYRQYPKNPKWDHDHCEFCWSTFMVEVLPDTLQQGYATEDDYRWICEQCFADFKDVFAWKVIDELP
jgi:hypothetical protein